MSVIFSRAPLRISLGGGGTDLPSYYRRARRLPRLRRDRQVRLHAHAHGLPAPLPDEVLRDRGGRRPSRRSATRSCARRCCATGAATRWRSPRSPTSPPAPGWAPPGAFTVCLLKAPRARASHGDHAGCAGRGRLRDRDRRARRARRQAGPVRRRARRHLRLHVQPRRHASTSSRSSSTPETLRDAARPAAAVLHRRGAQRRHRARPTRTSASKAGDDGDAREPPPRPRRWGTRAASCSWPAISRRYAELMHEHWETSAAARRAWRPSRSTRLYTLARRSGAIGGKLVGAGGGGFLLVYARRPRTRGRRWPRRARRSCAFDFEFDGAYASEYRERRPARRRSSAAA